MSMDLYTKEQIEKVLTYKVGVDVGWGYHIDETECCGVNNVYGSFYRVVDEGDVPYHVERGGYGSPVPNEKEMKRRRLAWIESRPTVKTIFEQCYEDLFAAPQRELDPDDYFYHEEYHDHYDCGLYMFADAISTANTSNRSIGPRYFVYWLHYFKNVEVCEGGIALNPNTDGYVQVWTTPARFTIRGAKKHYKTSAGFKRGKPFSKVA